MKKIFLFLLLAIPLSAKEHDYTLYPPNVPEHREIEVIPSGLFPQTNTFCAANLSCTVTGAWSFTTSPLTVSVTATFTGALTAKNLDAIRIVNGANSAGWAGAGPANWIDSAGADCGGNACVVLIASDTGIGDPTTPLVNVNYWDFRPKGTGDGPNEVAFNVWDGTAVNDQQGSTGSYARSLLTCGRVVPATANKSWACIRSYLYLPGAVMGFGPGLSSIAPILFTQTGTDTITNKAFANSLEVEIGFGGTGLSLYDIRGATINNILGVVSPTGTLGALKFFDTQPSTTIPSGFHIQKWIGYNAENPGVPAASMTATGTVNCNGTSTVTWASGDKFNDVSMIGYPITINSVVYTVATVTSPPGTTLTVNSATGGATTCPSVSGTAFTFNGNQYSEVMNGNIWLRADQSPASPTDSNGAGGIIMDTGIIGTGQLARSSIAIRDTAALRNSDGTYKRTYIDENNGALEIKNQAFTQNLVAVDALGNTAIFGNVSLAQNGAAFLPNSAGGNDAGATTLPLGNLWLGTAATNNFKFQPASTTGARIITIADPLSPTTVALPMTIASGTSSMTTALIATLACGTTVTTAATGVLTTDVIDWSVNAAVTAANNGLLILKAWPTAGNVNFNYCNPTAGSVTPTATTLNWSVRRP
jgi:hypothetical protein